MKFGGQERLLSKKDLEINRLEYRAKQLKKINTVINTCLHNLAYHNTNLDKQIEKLNAHHTPEWEIEILKDAYDYKSDLAKQIFTDLKKLIDVQRKEVIKVEVNK